jgi:methylmalonyl-CoA/ethylmalonyl-CoA epimerase
MSPIRSAAIAAAAVTLALSGPARAEGPLTDAKLLQITLPAKDLGQSVAFYRDTLGLKLLFQVEGAAFLDAGGVRLRLEAGGSAPSSGVELYFDDPALARAEPLKALGVKFVGPPETVQRTAAGDVQLLEFYDPTGNALALIGLTPRRTAAK